jgi:hypothetical protein
VAVAFGEREFILEDEPGITNQIGMSITKIDHEWLMQS